MVLVCCNALFFHFDEMEIHFLYFSFAKKKIIQGGGICVCPLRVNPKKSYDDVCNEFCVQRNFGIKGCRRCTMYSGYPEWDNNTDIIISNVTVSTEPHMGHIDGQSVMPPSPTTTVPTQLTTTAATEATTNPTESPAAAEDTPLSSGDAVSDDSMPTTEQSSSTIDSTTQSSETSTPNWDDWCQKLCATGEGGAACRCDLLPLAAD